MTDLELRLIHCEKEPSEVALYDAADAYLAVGDEEMYHGLKYMSDKKRMPWDTVGGFIWCSFGSRLSLNGYDDRLPSSFFTYADSGIHSEPSFSASVRWLGKRLIELGMVTA